MWVFWCKAPNFLFSQLLRAQETFNSSFSIWTLCFWALEQSRIQLHPLPMCWGRNHKVRQFPIPDGIVSWPSGGCGQVAYEAHKAVVWNITVSALFFHLGEIKPAHNQCHWDIPSELRLTQNRSHAHLAVGRGWRGDGVLRLKLPLRQGTRLSTEAGYRLFVP